MAAQADEGKDLSRTQGPARVCVAVLRCGKRTGLIMMPSWPTGWLLPGPAMHLTWRLVLRRAAERSAFIRPWR